MNRNIFIFLSFGFLFSSVGSLAVAEEWQTAKRIDGFKIYTKDSKGSPIQSLRIKGLIKANIYQVTTILRDVKSAKEWVPNIVKRSYVEDISDVSAVLHDITDMPWPASDRDIVVLHELKLSEDKKSLTLFFKSINHPKKKEIPGIVRASILDGRIIFTPKKKQTHVEMYIHVDPKGKLPAWIINLLQVDMPYDFVKALDQHAKNTKLKTRTGIKNLIEQIENEEFEVKK